jgi:RNA-directed DNA polymerase
VAVWNWFRFLWDPLLRLWRWLRDGSGFDVEELARRLGIPAELLQAFVPEYQPRQIPKRSGGKRLLFIPDEKLKALQRRILRRLLKRLRCHSAARGFQPGESIATNALPHAGQAVVVRLDLHDFFPTTSECRVWAYFRRIGWNRPAARLLTRLCTHEGGLPQGAPTSPRLSNLVNFLLDRRIAAMADKLGARYTRYADDITVSFAEDDRRKIRYLIRFVRRVAREEGYRVHGRKKLRVRRQHQQQRVTGLVVNAGVHLPRRTRRWLRAVEHHLRTGRPATLTRQQLAGWQALCRMIAQQAPAPAAPAAKMSENLLGSWVMTAVEHEGQSAPGYAAQEGPDPVVWNFEPDGLRIVQGRREKRATYTVDESGDPPALTITPADGLDAGQEILGIWLQQAEQITICLAERGRERPVAFTALPGSGQTVYRLRASVDKPV